MIEIKYKDKDIVVISKPFGMPTQPDPSKDMDAMTSTSQELRYLEEDDNLWLVHRLDRAVGGLMVFARNKNTAAILSEAVRERLVTKEYFAVVEGVPENAGTFTDFLYKDNRTNKAYVVKSQRNGVKEASLEYKTIERIETERGSRSLVYIKLHTGRFHQIRAQFSSRHFPLVGDKKYGSKDFKVRHIALFSSHLRIELPTGVVDLHNFPDISEYPWGLFKATSFEEI